MLFHFRGLGVICSLAALGLKPAGAAVTRKSGSASARKKAARAAASKWGPEDLGLGSAGDLPPLESSDASSSLISVPGEGVVEDEMVALQHPSEDRSPASPSWSPTLPSSGGATSVSALATAQAQSLIDARALEAQASKAATPAPAATVPERKPQVVDEYDVQPDADGEEDDDYRTTKMTETSTKEELERQDAGDVEHVQPKPAKRAPLLRKLKVAAAVEQSARVTVRDADAEAKAADAVEQAPGGDKMMGRCMAFASWVKGQGTTGPDLVRIWKGTCTPAVMSGTAPPNYNNMCNALGTAVSGFALKPWTPADICHAVLAVFRESGVGATPLAG